MLARTRLGLVAALIAILGVVVVRRWLGATRPQRRALTLVYASGGLVLALYAVWSLLGLAHVAPGTQETLERARVIALASVPFAFLAGLLRSRVAGAAAVSELVARLGDGRSAAPCATRWPTRSATRRWSSPTGCPSARSGSTRPAGGRARPAARRCCTPVERDGRPVAMLVHDASVAEERELVQAVGGAAALALENERLAAELRANVKELRASRARIVESADAARRRIERDLHDGAQQRLVALALSLRLARRRIDDDQAAAKATARRRVRQPRRGDPRAARARPRDPPGRPDRPWARLGAARRSRSACRCRSRSPLCRAAPARPVEAAAYFVVAEAITNVARYAHATHARVDVRRDGGALVSRGRRRRHRRRRPRRRLRPARAGRPRRRARRPPRGRLRSRHGTAVRAVIPISR